MSAKEHYDKHLANFYSWMTGDVMVLAKSFRDYCIKHKITPRKNARALDLGAGNGIQSIALEQLGFMVTAIDYNQKLLDELISKTNSVDIKLDDIRNVANYKDLNPELVVCCGDTITHLESGDDVKSIIQNIYELLSRDGKLMLTFRDYSSEQMDTNRFIPVKSDEMRIFTCFLEYFEDYIRVTDLLYEKENDKWIQKVSSYQKLRISCASMQKLLSATGFSMIQNELLNGMITLIAQK